MSGDGRLLTWLIPFGLLVLALVAVPLLIMDDQGLPRYRALRNELEQARHENGRLRHEVIELQREVDELRHDVTAVERIARDELGMIKKGELLLEFEN